MPAHRKQPPRNPVSTQWRTGDDEPLRSSAARHAGGPIEPSSTRRGAGRSTSAWAATSAAAAPGLEAARRLPAGHPVADGRPAAAPARHLARAAAASGAGRRPAAHAAVCGGARLALAARRRGVPLGRRVRDDPRGPAAERAQRGRQRLQLACRRRLPAAHRRRGDRARDRGPTEDVEDAEDITRPTDSQPWTINGEAPTAANDWPESLSGGRSSRRPRPARRGALMPKEVKESVQDWEEGARS